MIDNRAFFDAIDKIQLTPVTIRNIFLLLTRLHYSTPENYGPMKKKLQQYVWSSDPKVRTIHIAQDYEYDAGKLDKVPAIFVGLDDIEYKKVVTGNHNKFSYDRSGEHLVKTASTKVIIRHIGNSADEAMTLENLTVQFFLGLQPIIRDTLPQVMEYDVLGSKSSRPFEKTSQQADQRFISDTIIAFGYNSAWLVRFESHRIKTIDWETCLAECGKSG